MAHSRLGLWASPRQISAHIFNIVFEVFWKSSLVLLAWSVVDYIAMRQKFESGLRMSKQEIREEMKQTDGNPATKGRIRRLQRLARRKRMLQAARRATVVVTNPTHFAVALEYSDEMAAPTVVAKGQNLLAQQIKEIARWDGIPIIENPPLAQSLYRTVEVGQAIPEKLYAAVAEILAYVFRMNAQQHGPEEFLMAEAAKPASFLKNANFDWIVPAAAVSVVFVMLVPMPSFLLDLLLAMSITAAVIVLLSAVYILRPVQFSVFPSLLLLLTLFRLALNLASSPPHSAPRQ